MELRGSHLIILVTVLFPATMTITFTLAVCYEHVYPVMPFISYTGDKPIESCIFSLGLNLVAAFYFVIMFIRYNQLIKFCESEETSHVNTILRLNKKALPWGLTSSLGLSVTGSFQEIHLAFVHRIAALICTYTGFVYLWYQSILSDLVVDRLNSKSISLLRTALSIASTSIHVVAPVLVAILDTTYPKRHEDTLVWRREEDGWVLHISCSFLEWTIFFINVTYNGRRSGRRNDGEFNRKKKDFVTEWKKVTPKRRKRHRAGEAAGKPEGSGPPAKANTSISIPFLVFILFYFYTKIILRLQL